MQLDNLYGSPSVEDIEAFQQALAQELDAVLDVSISDALEVEVSSPVGTLTISKRQCHAHWQIT